MQSLLTELIECSALMSALALLFIAATPLLSKRYDARWMYYSWLVIIIGLIIPFRPHIIQVYSSAVPLTFMHTIPIAGTNAKTASSGLKVPWYQAAVCLWLAGAVLSVAYRVLKHLHFVRTIKRWSKDTADQQLLDTLQKQKNDLGISGQIKLKVCSCIASPMMIGFISPVILMPRSDFSADALSLVIRHELIHFKRKDLWYKSLIALATSIHWFNPVVYFIARAISVQCEISCDAETVKDSDITSRQHYGETIINVIKSQSKMQTAFSTNLYGGKNDMKKRIYSIMDTNKKKAGTFILSLVLAGTMMTGVAFAATPNTADTSKPAKYSLKYSSYTGPLQKTKISDKNLGTPSPSWGMDGKLIKADNKTDLLAAVKAYLTEQVSSGKMTQEKADQIYNQLVSIK